MRIMIIGFISSNQSHIQLIKTEMLSKFKFICLEEKDIVSLVGIGKLVNADKIPLLNNLQKIYGNVFISGDAIWDEKACHHLLSTLHGMLLIDTTPLQPNDLPSGQYWTQEGITNTVEWRKQLVVTHEADFLDYLDFSNKAVHWHLKSLSELIQRYDDKKDVINVSMEDVIKQAMTDLGIDLLQEVVADSPQQKVQISDTESSEDIDENISEGADDIGDTGGNISENTDDEPATSVSESQTSSSNTYRLPPATIQQKGGIKVRNVNNPPKLTENSVALKLTNGTISLLIPANLQLPIQTINKKEYNVLVFTAPNLGNTELQSLKIHNNSSVTPQPIQPIKTSTKSHTKYQNSVTGNSDLQQLVAQKVQLDQAIKIARAANDELTVNELRKQRRSVRRQINAIGGASNETA